MNFSGSRAAAEWARKWYPAFSRRATQVCILSSALEKIALGAPYAREIAHAALAEADAFGWNKRMTQQHPHGVQVGSPQQSQERNEGGDRG